MKKFIAIALLLALAAPAFAAACDCPNCTAASAAPPAVTYRSVVAPAATIQRERIIERQAAPTVYRETIIERQAAPVIERERIIERQSGAAYGGGCAASGLSRSYGLSRSFAAVGYSRGAAVSFAPAPIVYRQRDVIARDVIVPAAPARVTVVERRGLFGRKVTRVDVR